MSLSRPLRCFCSIILVLFTWRVVRASVECKITSKFSGEEGGRIVVKFCLGNQLIFSLRNRCELTIVWQTHQDLLIRLSLTLVQEKQSKVHMCKIIQAKSINCLAIIPFMKWKDMYWILTFLLSHRPFYIWWMIQTLRISFFKYSHLCSIRNSILLVYNVRAYKHTLEGAPFRNLKEFIQVVLFSFLFYPVSFW